jgi:hypothetical protein
MNARWTASIASSTTQSNQTPRLNCVLAAETSRHGGRKCLKQERSPTTDLLRCRPDCEALYKAQSKKSIKMMKSSFYIHQILIFRPGEDDGNIPKAKGTQRSRKMLGNDVCCAGKERGALLQPYRSPPSETCRPSTLGLPRLSNSLHLPYRLFGVATRAVRGSYG